MKNIKTFEGFVETHGKVFWGTQACGVIPVCTTTKRILLGLRSYDVQEPRTWGGFGGKIDEEDSDVKIAVLRELEEETEYSGDIELIDAFVYEHGNFKYYNFFGLVSEEFEPILNWENDDFKWFTYKELIRLKDKHFGLRTLLDNSSDLLKSLIK